MHGFPLRARSSVGVSTSTQRSESPVPSQCVFLLQLPGYLLQQVLVLHAASSAAGGIFNVRLLCFLLAENFVRDEAIGLDISLASDPLIKANYLESHHKVK